MQKQYYDHKTKLCEKCAHFKPAGERPAVGGGETLTWWPDACWQYGYSLTGKYPELADNCEGFQTPAEYKAEQQRKELEKKRKKTSKKQ